MAVCSGPEEGEEVGQVAGEWCGGAGSRGKTQCPSLLFLLSQGWRNSLSLQAPALDTEQQLWRAPTGGRHADTSSRV